VLHIGLICAMRDTSNKQNVTHVIWQSCGGLFRSRTHVPVRLEVHLPQPIRRPQALDRRMAPLSFGQGPTACRTAARYASSGRSVNDSPRILY
jgi:hypothetical protein